MSGRARPPKRRCTDSELADLCGAVSRRRERSSIVPTTNQSCGEWAEVFSGDGVLAAAVLTRFLQRSHVVSSRSKDHRLKDGRKAGTLSGKGEKTTPATRAWVSLRPALTQVRAA